MKNNVENDGNDCNEITKKQTQSNVAKKITKMYVVVLKY